MRAASCTVRVGVTVEYPSGMGFTSFRFMAVFPQESTPKKIPDVSRRGRSSRPRRASHNYSTGAQMERFTLLFLVAGGNIGPCRAAGIGLLRNAQQSFTFHRL